MIDIPFGSHSRWSISLLVSVVSLTLGSWVFATEFFPFVVTLLTVQSESDSSGSLNRALEGHSALAKTSADRLTGRSLFTMPTPPTRPTPQPVAPVAPIAPPPPPPPPSIPLEYQGPKPSGMLGDLVYFEGNITILVGEEKSGVRVIAVEPPSNVRLEHLRGTYSVPIWVPTDWTKLSAKTLLSGPPIIQPATTPAVPPAPATAPGSSGSSKSAPTADSGRGADATRGPRPAVVSAPATRDGGATGRPVAETSRAPVSEGSAADTTEEPNPDAPDAQRQRPRSAPTAKESPSPGSVAIHGDDRSNQNLGFRQSLTPQTVSLAFEPILEHSLCAN